MATNFSPEDLTYEKLKGSHDLSAFKCEINDLNEFLGEKALQQMVGKINVTYLTFLGSDLVAYFTLSTDAIKIVNILPEDKKLLESKGIPYSSLPALKLCRLAVDNRYKRMGIGTYLVEKVIKQALKLSEDVGLRYITVDAYIKTHKFYIENDNLDFTIWPEIAYKIRRWNESENKDETATVPVYMDIHDMR